MRYLVEIAYDGSGYAGWQVQDNAHSVQQALDDALGIVLRVPITTIGSSRTDTGVHARCNFAHFDFEGELPDRLLRSVNAVLPDDIAVKAFYTVPDGFNARFEATHRRYKYIITLNKNPFERATAWYFPFPLPEIYALEACAELLLSHTDYTAFCKAHGNNKTNICNITEAVWQHDTVNGLLSFTVTSNRFLRGMVRALVATQIMVARGKMTLAAYESILKEARPQSADFSAPAEGLTLIEVGYDWAKLKEGFVGFKVLTQ